MFKHCSLISFSNSVGVKGKVESSAGWQLLGKVSFCFFSSPRCSSPGSFSFTPDEFSFLR